jgi:hypothetical protein
MKHLIKQIEKMDVKTEEWNDLYHAVREKHWNTEPELNDDYFQCAKLLNMLANCDSPDLIILTTKIANEAFKVLEQKQSVVTAEIHVGTHKLYFRLANSKDAIDNLQRQLTNTILVKAQEEAEPTPKGDHE